MKEKVLEIAGGNLQYRIEEGRGVRIIGWRGQAAEVEIPKQIDGLPVTEIEKKAFLSNKSLLKVRLPEGIVQIGDWAFAYCDRLEEIELPCREISFGRAVLLECSSLREISICDKNRMTAALLAAAIIKMDAYYLLNVREAGSSEWLSKWDAKMLALVRTPDQEGYSKQVLCGEEDYGSTDMEAYMSSRRKEKVRLILLRLLYPDGLKPPIREEMRTYLQDHTKGGKSEETWQVIWQEYGDERAYYELFAESGCLREDNVDAILWDIGEEYPEMKAFFLRYKKENIKYSDFFQELEL
ncbi:MAG: leucine-rich repeat domain-containing protein [Candidatus Gastranaerophilales bacterium]|nr:leucine-rich repeat domain-containing protein [Candidatus Gastranaerophilales bacterium]